MKTPEQLNDLYPGNDFGDEQPEAVVQEELIERRYWTIGQVAALLKTTESRIRFHVDTIPMDLPRNHHMNRMFRKKDIETLAAFHKLIDAGFTLEGAVKHLKKADKILTAIA